MNKDTETIDDNDAALIEWLKDETPINAREHNIDVLKKAVEKHSAFVFTWGGKARILVDVQTANMVMTIYNALNPANQEKTRLRISKSKESFLLLITQLWKFIK